MIPMIGVLPYDVLTERKLIVKSSNFVGPAIDGDRLFLGAGDGFICALDLNALVANPTSVP